MDKEVNELDESTPIDKDASTTLTKRKHDHHKQRPPRENSSSCMFFSKSMREELRMKYPDKHSNANTRSNNKELCKMIRAKFKPLDPDQQKLFDKWAKDDVNRRKDEMTKHAAEVSADDHC